MTKPMPGERGTLADRFEKLDRTGRRCVGSDMRCERNAAFILTVVEVDPQTGQERGEPEDRRVCPRHRKFYGEIGEPHNGFRVIRQEPLPPVGRYDGLRRQHAESETARLRREQQERTPRDQ